jgi:hypothetical protein
MGGQQRTVAISSARAGAAWHRFVSSGVHTCYLASQLACGCQHHSKGAAPRHQARLPLGRYVAQHGQAKACRDRQR